MKTKSGFLNMALALLALLTFDDALTTVQAQGTAFTYQGQLMVNGAPAGGSYDLQFILYNASVGGDELGPILTNAATPVSNGLFTVMLDFGSGLFNGTGCWLDIAARPNGPGAFSELSPRQALTPTPYATFANTASNLSGTVQAEQLIGIVPLAQLPATVVTNDEGGVTLGNLTLGGNLTLPSPASVYSGANTILLSDSLNNFYAGQGAGSVSNSGSGGSNTGIGYEALGKNVNGTNNTAIGARALFNNTSGNENMANGYQALLNNTNGSFNTAVGSGALGSLKYGSNNIALGYLAGNNYTGGASSNILIGNPGVGGDNNTIRIGSGQSTAYIAGVLKGDGGGLTNLDADQLSGPVLSANFSGTYANAVTLDNASNNFSGGFTGNGANVTNVNATSLNGLPAANFWQLSGNAATSGQFIGTVNSQPVQIDVNNQRALLLQYSGASQAPNVIGGSVYNQVSNKVYGATIGGGGGYGQSYELYYGAYTNGDASQSNTIGGFYGTIAGGAQNVVNGPLGFVGGGYQNTASGSFSVVCGGYECLATGQQAFVGGGGGYYRLNEANASWAAVCGGSDNQANGGTSFIGGGWYNTITTNGYAGAIGGGSGNSVGGDYASIPGGYSCTANGFGSLASGSYAQALSDGTFVWADDSDTTSFSSTAVNQFLIRARGGVGIGTDSPEQSLSVVGGMNIDQSNQNTGTITGNALTFGSASGEGIASKRTGSNPYDLEFYTGGFNRLTILHSGAVGIANTNPGNLLVVGNAVSPAYCNGSVWQNGSDRNAKTNFAPVNPRTVLDKVSALPITQWQYKAEAVGTEHLGPMAQDFHEAFGLNGPDDTHIATVDESGVALAAIQGLNQKLESETKEKDAQIKVLKAKADKVDLLERQNDLLAARLNELEETVKQLVAQK